MFCFFLFPSPKLLFYGEFCLGAKPNVDISSGSGNHVFKQLLGMWKNWALQCSQAHLFPLIPTYVLYANPLWWRALFLSAGNHRHSPALLNRVPGCKGNALKQSRRNKYQYWPRSDELWLHQCQNFTAQVTCGQGNFPEAFKDLYCLLFDSQPVFWYTCANRNLGF